MFLAALVCLILSEQHYSKSERIAIEFFHGGVQGGTMKN